MKKGIIRSDWSGTKPGEKMGSGIFRTGTFKNMKKTKMKKVYCKNCKYFIDISKNMIFANTWQGESYFCVAGKVRLRWHNPEKHINKDNNCKNYKRKWWKVWVR